MVNICCLVILNNLYTLRVPMWYMGTHYIVHTGVQDVHALRHGHQTVLHILIVHVARSY